VTEALAQLEGLERGPAGNTSLAAAFVIAQELDADAVVVVQETEYTGAGKHPTAQLTFARQMGVEVRRGHPRENVPGRVIAIPRTPDELSVEEIGLDPIRRSFLRRAVPGRPVRSRRRAGFLAAELNVDAPAVERWVSSSASRRPRPSGPERCRSGRDLAPSVPCEGSRAPELAQGGGVSRGLISQVELDRANPSVDTSAASPRRSTRRSPFFDRGPTNRIVVRSDERRTIAFRVQG
jgi:hypothetical protein